MSEIIQAFLNHDIKLFIESIGYVGVFSVIFAGSGLLIGVILPGDSLIFTAGLLASPSFGFFNIWVLLTGILIAAVFGNIIGYEFGKRVGKRLFTKEDSLLFHKDNLIKAHEFYAKHGGKAIVLARFMPVFRTFVPIAAGIGDMDYKRFTLFNIVGGTIWVCGMGLLGFVLGTKYPNAEEHLFTIILLIASTSFIPPLIHMYKEHKKSFTDKLKTKLKSIKYRI